MKNKRRKKKKQEEYNKGFVDAIACILIGILLAIWFLHWSVF